MEFSVFIFLVNKYLKLEEKFKHLNRSRVLNIFYGIQIIKNLRFYLFFLLTIMLFNYSCS